MLRYKFWGDSAVPNNNYSATILTWLTIIFAGKYISSFKWWSLSADLWDLLFVVRLKFFLHGLRFVMLCCGLVQVKFYPYSSGLLHMHWGNHMIAPVPVVQAWRIWVKHNIKNHHHDHNKTKQNKTMCILYVHDLVVCLVLVIMIQFYGYDILWDTL